MTCTPLLFCCLAGFLHAATAQFNPTVEAVSQCLNGSPTLILQVDKSAANAGIPAQTITASVDDCARHCRENNSPDGPIVCAGFEYDGQSCTIYEDMDTTGIQDGNTAVYQKICIESDRICQSPFTFEMRAQKILVGFARDVSTQDTPEACLQHCLNSQAVQGFECESAMYYPAEDECILNTEDRRDRPGLFVDEAEDEVIYFDNNCAGSQCYAPDITQYLQIQDKGIANENDQIIEGVPLQSCSDMCTRRLSKQGTDFNCKSFMYNQDTNQCILSDEKAKPLGRATVVDAPGNYYEKQCFTSPRVCRNTPAFDRVPGMILVGFAAFVLENVASVSQCLDACIDPPTQETGADFVCSSVMYYYNEQECILNTETRTTQPDLFIPEGEGFTVDYFDFVCSPNEPEQCLDGQEGAIRYSGTSVSGAESISVEGLSEQGCIDACFSSAPSRCRSFNYNNGQCDLMYVSSDTGVLQPSGGDFYEIMCLEKQCPGEAAAFDCAKNSRSNAAPIDILPAINAFADCLSACAAESCAAVNYDEKSGACELLGDASQSPSEADRVIFCSNNCVSPGLGPRPRPPVDPRPPRPPTPPRKKPLKPQPAPKRPPPTAEGIHTVCTFNGIEVTVSKDRPFSGAIFAKNKYDTCRLEVKDERYATLTLGFPVEMQAAAFGKVSIDARPGVPGPYAKSRRKRQGQPGAFQPDGGRVDPAPINRPDAQAPALFPPPPTVPIRDCGVVDQGDGTFKAMVVVQMNNLGIPGLVTSMDHIYEVSCDYSQMNGAKVEAEAAGVRVEGLDPTDIKPQGKIEMASPVMMHMLSAGAPGDIIQAEIGDILELNWEMMIDDNLDFFVRECIAERGPAAPGTAPAATQLTLIERGCATPGVAGKLMPEPVKKVNGRMKSTKLQAFRFDGSRTVRIICQLDICQGECNPTTCDYDGKDSTSLGRKKRDITDENIITDPLIKQNKLESSRYIVPKNSQAVASLIILDPLQEVTVNHNKNLRSKHHNVVAIPKESTEFNAEKTAVFSQAGNVCLQKSTFLGVFLFLGVLAVVQVSLVGAYVTKRLSRQQAKQ